jgi:cytochrome c biogenesis protein CcmG/thiol:disulfide interchange protein DsbE
MKNWRVLVAASILAIGAIVVNAQGGQGEALKGKPFPSFKMTDTTGKVHTNASLKGKVVLLDFWATWCGPCKAASPTMQKLHEKCANTFERPNDRAGAAAKYKKEHNYSYTFTKENDKLAQQLGVSGIPFFVFIDRKGVVREVATGFGAGESPAQFEAIVKNLLK